MLRHKYSVFIFFILLVIFYVLQVSIVFYILLILIFLGITSWGVFDIRLNYFSENLCKKRNSKLKEIAITFDDGPHNSTNAILDVLSKHNAKATFFCVGKQIEKYPEIFKRIIDDGHLVGNHSYSHLNSHGFYSTKKVISEIEKTNNLIFQVTNKQNRFYRPPFGITNPNIERAVKHTKQIIIGWNIRSLDTVINDEKVILNRIINKVQPGSIILLHDTSTKTVAVLEQLLLFLQKENYKVKTIEELLDI
jgi:peptidoglycan/xylan/chitin deacetylase (PgdA/CDA1 family)